MTNLPQTLEEWIERERYQRERDELDVGPLKPLGYTSYVSRKEAFDMYGKLVSRDLDLILWKAPYEKDEVTFLMAYHFEGLQRTIDDNEALLDEAGWPTMPDDFVFRVMSDTAFGPSAMFDLVADCFNDKANTGRRDIRAMSWYEEAVEILKRRGI